MSSESMAHMFSSDEKNLIACTYYHFGKSEVQIARALEHPPVNPKQPDNALKPREIKSAWILDVLHEIKEPLNKDHDIHKYWAREEEEKDQAYRIEGLKYTSRYWGGRENYERARRSQT
ncbi:MAG: hypothetical protein Q9166_005304 [cf. Caloplaca sp. 2 TL-2023]